MTDCGEQEYVFIHCKNCFKNKEMSGAMVVLMFDDGIELYCRICGAPVTQFGEREKFHFSNISEAEGHSATQN